MNYSGKTSFTFEVERFKSKFTGSFLSDEELKDAFESTYEYLLVPLQIEGTSYFTSGRSYGPAENCFPDEGDTEITSCVDKEGKDWEPLLTEYERDIILEKIVQDSHEGYEPDEADYVDYD